MTSADHLQVPRQHGLFLHHGIDLGDGTVAHYLEGREIIRSSLKDFSQGQKPTIVFHPHCSPKGITLRRAMNRIGEQRYNLLFNNCEHFANWCKTGRHRSEQMESWLHKSSLGAIAFGQLMPAAILTGLKLILQQGLIDDSSRALAKAGLIELTKIRKKLIDNLEASLEKADQWIHQSSQTSQDTHKKSNQQNLVLKGQTIADELTAIEELEARINDLLNEPATKS